MENISNSRLFDLMFRWNEKFPKQDALGCKEKGTWKTFSTTDFIDYSNNLAYGLLNLGLQKGDKIALIANNRPEWNFADMAMQMAGIISVPIYPTISETDLQFILNDAEIKYAFVSTKELADKVKKAASGLSFFKGTYCFDKVSDEKHYSELIENGKANKKEKELEEIKKSILNTELVSLLYTSGTTGTPKGVMLSHRNLASNSYAVRNLAPFKPDWKALSFLPLNHVYERMLCYVYMSQGVSIYYAENLETIGDNLKEVKPQMFVTVPRLLEKVYDKIVAKGTELTGIKKKLFFWALDLGLRYELNGANGWWYEFQLKIANILIFSKWREALGGNVVAVASGGAALQPRLARVFNAAKITVLEGYGLTETSPVVAVNNFEPNSIRFGTVGPVIEGVEVKLAEDGEICVKGPNVMMGYYNRPDATAEVMDSEGWFRTGDIGIFEEGRFLKITDRKKEIFKTSGGKYITPQSIENKLKESRFIEQVCVIGENQKFAAALVVPAFVFLKEWCERKGITYSNNAELCANEQVKSRIMQEVEEANKTLAQYETIKKIELISEEWSIEKGELTPKMSMKRKAIMKKHDDLVNKIYS
ncbi:MAG: long-chain fatty acid--CoA ligase [Bacteroidota bacterium]